MTDRPAPEVPVSRQLGRATGRWWNRHGDTVKQVSRPARKGWATLAGYLWFVAYMWVGLMIAGLEVPHVHLHVVPINGVHDLDFANAARDPDPADMDAAQQAILEQLRAAGHDPGC